MYFLRLTILATAFIALLLTFVSGDLYGQTMNEKILAIDIVDSFEPEKTKEYNTFYFADIMEARRKLTNVRTIVEQNYINNILSDKKYKKQLFSLNNALEYLDLIEDRRKRYLNKKRK